MSVTVGRARRDFGVVVARPTALGNPFIMGPDGTREEVIEKYRMWLYDALSGDPSLSESKAREMYWRLVRRAREGDVRLLCYCSPDACHADVIAESINAHVAAETADMELTPSA